MSEMRTLTVNGKSYTLSDEVARQRLAQLAEAAAVQAPAIVCAASGSSIPVADAADRPLQGLKLFGKTVQASAPSPDAPQALHSIGDGGRVTVTVSGEAPSGQTLTVETPGGLPGVPVAAEGNYTDGNGQQWICDEIDFARGVYVQRVHRAAVGAGDISSVQDGNAYATIVPPAPNYYTTGLCSHAKIKYSSSPGVGYFGISPNGVLIFGTDKTNLSDFRAWLGAENILVFTPTQAAPVETPLSAEELAAYAALHTNKSATTVLNDAGAHMELSYVADTKAYIDRRLGL